jgi:hypothetical protein
MSAGLLGGYGMNLKTLKNTPPWDWPEDAGTVIMQTLADSQAKKSERLLAVELAGETVVLDDKIADALLAIVGSSDESENLRARAAISLGPGLEEADLEGFDEDDDEPHLSQRTFDAIQKTFRSLFHDARVPKEVRRRVLEASVRSPQDWHAAAVRSAYAGDDEEWRLTAVFCMRYVKGFEDQILEALESGDSEVQYEAVRAAGEWEVDGAWPHIADLLTAVDTDKILLLAAIDAAAAIRPDDASGILGVLADSDDEDIAEAAMDALSMAEGESDWDDPDDDEYDEEDEEDF